MPGVHITQEQADEFAVGAVEPELAGLIVLHCDECADCRELVREAEQVAAMLALGAPRKAPPEHLRSRVLRSAGIVRPGFGATALRFASAGTGVAAVILAIAALVGFFRVSSQVDDLEDQNAELQADVDGAASTKVELAVISSRLAEEEQLTEELRVAAQNDRDLLVALLSPESDVTTVVSVNEDLPGAVGRLVWDQQQERMWFVASRLDRLPDGQTYQLWVYDGSEYVDLGTFNADESGFARHQNWVPQGLESYDSAVVTIESAPGAFEREGPSVFVTDLSSLGD